MERKVGLKYQGVLALVLLLVSLGLLSGQARGTTVGENGEVVWLTWGGVFYDVFSSVVPDFEHETGIKVTMLTFSGAADGLSTLLAQRHNPQVDLYGAIDSTALKGFEEGVLQELPRHLIPNLEHVPSQYITPYSTAFWVSLRGIFYRSDMVPFELHTWEDLWDPRLKDLVAATIQLDTGNFLIVASLLNGGNERNIDAGFEKISELRPNLALFYRTDAESIKFLQNGEAAVAAWGGLPNVYKLLGPGSVYKFVIPKAPQLVTTTSITMVKGRNNEENAARFIDYLLRPDVQEKMTSQVGTVPANSHAKVPDQIENIVPPLDQVYRPDLTVVNENFSAWLERWNRDIQRR